MYGTTIHLPGEFFARKADDETAQASKPCYAPQVCYAAAATDTCVQAISAKGACQSVPVDVFVRRNAVRKPLQHTYDGPYEVIQRSDKYFTLKIKGRSEVIPLDRLKPVHLDMHIHISAEIPPAAPKPLVHVSQPSSTDSARVSRSGYYVHWPKQFSD